MIQNANYEEVMVPEEESAISLKELALLFLSKWYWFVISVIVCVTIASIKLMRTPPSYTRSSLVLIKEDAKGRSMGTDVASTFSDMGLFRTRTNIENEIVNFQSPDLMYEVVKRLHLDVNYKVEGPFYDRTLYGDQLPVVVSFDNIKNRATAALTVSPKSAKQVTLSDFVRDGEKVVAEPVVATLGKPVKTPVGQITVSKSPYPNEVEFDKPIFVTRGSLYNTATAYQHALQVALANKETTVIQLSVNDVNIQRAEELLNTVVNVYNEIWIKDKNQITTSTNEFINERLKVIQKELGSVDNTITSYKSANMIPDLAASAGIAMQQSAQEQKHIIDLNNQLNIARYLLSYIRGSENRLIPANAGLQETSIQSFIYTYNETQLQRNRLVESSSEENLLVKDLDQQLASLRVTVQNSIENYITALNMQMKSAQGARAQANASISNNPRQAGALLSSERQQKVKEALYLYLLQKREENELSQAFTSYNVRVVATPEHSGTFIPTAPLKGRTLMIAFLIGLIIPGAYFFLRETLNSTVRGRKDLENMAVPFVGEIPQAYRKKRTLKDRLFGLLPRVVAVRLMPKKEEGENTIIVHAKSRNIINEAFRVVRTNMEFMSGRKGEGAQVIMITSANPGSGKTFITANLATAMAVKGKRVLAIDLDLRKKSLGTYFGQPKVGISDYLSGKQDDYKSLILHQKVDDIILDVLTVGTLPPNPAELLSDERLEKMITELREKYDYIFLDCPPIEIVTDADIVNRLADTTLFVVRVGLLERNMLPMVDKFYNTQKYKNMCIVLNGIDRGGRYGYKYGYKYGYTYGHKSGYYGYGDNE